MAKTLDEVVQFLRDAGFQITSVGPNLWHVRFAHLAAPDRALDDQVAGDQLMELYAAIKQGYNQFIKQK